MSMRGPTAESDIIAPAVAAEDIEIIMSYVIQTTRIIADNSVPHLQSQMVTTNVPMITLLVNRQE